MRVPWVLAIVLVLLAGCGQPAAQPAPTVTYAPPPQYPLTFKVTQETPDGPPIVGAEVYLVPRQDVSSDPNKLPPPRYTDDRGLIGLTYRDPVTLVVQAFGPGQKGGGWTREGLTLQVGANVTADRGRVAGRTVTLPLLRAELPFSVNASWGPAMATPAANGSVTPAEQRTEIPVPAAYAGRLASVRLDLAWTQTPQAFGDLYAGLARGGAVLKGSDSLQPPSTGSPEKESVQGTPAGDGPLQAVALTNSAVQGTLALHFTGTLKFNGDWPRELPLPACFAVEACVPLPVVPPR